MSILERTSFTRGWVPDADAVNGPVDGLLRADNCILDELGAVTLRRGAALLGGPYGSLDVHSLFTVVLNTTRYRMAGVSDAIYANGSSIVATVAGTGDVQFGSHMGQILMARSTTKKKYDGTVRNWGISMTGGAPTASPTAADSKTFATCDQADAEFTWAGGGNEDDGTGAGYATGQDGTANGAIVLKPNATTKRGTVTKTFAAATDFTSYTLGLTGDDDDLIEFYLYTADPDDLLTIELMIDVNASATNAFQGDYYYHEFLRDTAESLGPTGEDALAGDYTTEGRQRRKIKGDIGDGGDNHPDPISRIRHDKPVANIGWSRLQVRRGRMARIGQTSTKDWSTVKALRIVAKTITGTELRFDAIRIVSGSTPTPSKYRYVYVRNDGSYTAKSAPSALSAEVQITRNGATVTAPADASRDTQINEIWLYRMGGLLESFYRVAVKTGVSGTGSVAITDPLSDADTLVVDLRLETDTTTPPANIIGIEGPYFDRILVLTSDGYVWPSRQLNPDSFATGEAIRITGPDEQPLWIKKTLGGLFIGTTKDVYVLEGDGTVLPDETINFSRRPLNIDHAPTCASAVAQEGNLLVYFAHDGWRALAGGGSQSLTGPTSLLYRKYTRHGVGPVNAPSGRFRAAIARGQLVAVTPEGTDAASSTVLYRYLFARSHWYRHTYVSAWRCIYREPDGTLIASDTAGYVWELDAAAGGDNGTGIPITIWTKQDDNGSPFNRKDPLDLRVQCETGAATLSVALHRDASDSADLTIDVVNTTVGVTSASLQALTAWRLLQLRLTGTFQTFRLASFGVQHEPFPVPIRGRTTPNNFGEPRLKTLTGFQARVGTFGVTRTLTPIVDGVPAQSLSVASGVDTAVDATLTFTRPVTGTAFALETDGDVEIFSWTPLITTTRPLGAKAHDTGPLDLGTKEQVWIREVWLKVIAGADLVVTPYFDGRAYPAYTATIGPELGAATTIRVPVGREYHGRVPRLLITSSEPFYPYHVEFLKRDTGTASDKRPIRVPLAPEVG